MIINKPVLSMIIIIIMKEFYSSFDIDHSLVLNLLLVNTLAECLIACC